MADSLHRFLFEDADVRGELVQLDESWQALLSISEYPDTVRNQLGQAVAASVLLSGTIKYDGSLIMQLQGKGPISLLVAQATNKRTFRGLARWEGEVPEGNLPETYGEGYLAITLEPEGKGERYQGVVPLEGDNMADAVSHYFTQSEQLDTHIFLAANGARAVGLLLQKLPEYRQIDQDGDDAWNRINQLGSTITDAELLGLPVEEVLHRLFHEEDIRLFDAEPVAFACTCSEEKLVATLRGLGKEELQKVLEEHGSVEADCEFCNRHYSFDIVDLEAMFSEGQEGQQGSDAKH